MGAHQVATRQYDAQIITANNLADQDESAEQREPAGAGDRQGHPRAATCGLGLPPVGDQQEG